MVRLVVLVGLAMGLAACQPLYGGKPEKLSNPKPKKKPDQPAEVEAPVKYVEDCNANFRDDPKKLSRDTPGSQDLVVKGDETLVQADKTPEPKQQGSLVATAIDKYINALRKDPFNADATLKLALAYDRVLRKGCALKLLARLPQLEANEKFRKQAKLAADQVTDNKEWFRGYHKEAVAAAGR